MIWDQCCHLLHDDYCNVLQKKLQGAMKSDARFAQFLLDPTVKNTLKVDGLTGASKKLGFNELTTNLLFALAENNR